MEDILNGATSGGVPPIPASYYENFLESIAQILSRLLTDRETETVIASIRSFQEKLNRLSSNNLRRLHMEITASEKSGSVTPLCRHEGKTCAQNCTRGFLKTFAVAFLVKYLVGILPTLLTGNIFKRPGILKQMAGRDTAGFALFLSTFTSGYKGILCALRHYRKNNDPKSDRLNSIIAGCLSGLALVFDRDRQRRQSIMLYLLTRALQFNGGYLMKRWAIHRKEDHPGETKWDDKLASFMSRFAGVGVMMLSNAQTIYAFVFNADTLPKSYYGFLLTHAGFRKFGGGMAPRLSEAAGATVHQLTDDNSLCQLPIGMTSREYVAQHISPNIAARIPSKLRHEHVLCTIQHSMNEGCLSDKVFLSFDEFKRAIKLYLPLNVIMLAFRLKQLRTNPVTVLQKFTFSTLRSTVFLTMFVVSGFSALCGLRHATGVDRPWMYAVAGALSGTTVLLEAPGRRLEMGLYCLTRSIESFWKTAIKNGYVKNIPHGDILLFMACMGTIMPIYQQDKETISSHYLAVMTRFFGEN